ncbi:zinc finger protein [Encephalitozoon cuniculi GB-M1]|uniref:Zinc finger C2H2 protein ECU02_0310 n=2 Tax=Encephalitozoon cuniculi TaxID=6035 RepID=BUD20_ENCCU|nr:Bud20p-like protein [Encephalitozoon cuniculi GB-M1]Q8SWF6.1 RecName: Full=Zinc finger C2H2 protein ECU02_0310 [Encephalitozoon cuniculi GB-M1]AGE95638.1 zinc finger protein [Encephalitozoon cuniculi]KMV66550.1 zinc finger domain-containing protein [Encephalitozoon cuniculi EcunIII-L]UYI28219.1 putative zinc finger protein [Encephalitozoon cuniculi]CAD25062.1 zinc finger protein [Encephalitozoon cuniculi GB-M1]
MPKSDTKQKKRRSNKNRLRIKRARLFGPKDIDQVKEDIESQKKIEYDPELPGGGHFYCCECDRHFITEKVLMEHKRSNPHRRRAKEVREVAHSQRDAEWAVGLT